jgi:hypothetical protein
VHFNERTSGLFMVGYLIFQDVENHGYLSRLEYLIFRTVVMNFKNHLDNLLGLIHVSNNHPTFIITIIPNFNFGVC